MTLQIGQKLYGYCGGQFDRYYLTEFYIVEAVGFDWIVVRDDSGIPHTTTGREALELLESDECTKPKEEEE